MTRWTGRKSSRNRPAIAITNFLDMDEKRILFIYIKSYQVNCQCQGLVIKIRLFNHINNEEYLSCNI